MIMHPISTIANNINDVAIEGSFDISAAAAVTAARGDGVFGNVTKTGTGAYRLRVPRVAHGCLRVVEKLVMNADYAGSPPATALTVRVFDVQSDATPGATQGDVLVDFLTGTAAYVPVDTTAATTISFRVVFRCKPRVG